MSESGQTPNPQLAKCGPGCQFCEEFGDELKGPEPPEADTELLLSFGQFTVSDHQAFKAGGLLSSTEFKAVGLSTEFKPGGISQHHPKAVIDMVSDAFGLINAPAPDIEPETLAEKVKAAVAKTVPTTPEQQKQWESLAAKLEDISIKHGVRAMSHVAALAIAKEFSKLFNIKTPTNAFNEAAEAMQGFAKTVEQKPHALYLQSTNTPGMQEISVSTTGKRVQVNVPATIWSEDATEMSKIAANMLQEKIDLLLPGWVLMSQPHLLTVGTTAVKVVGWAMPRATYVVAKGVKAPLGNWQKMFGAGPPSPLNPDDYF